MLPGYVALLVVLLVGVLGFLAWQKRRPAPAPAPPAPPAGPPHYPISAVNAATLWAGVAGAVVPPYVHLDLLVPVPPGVDPTLWMADASKSRQASQVTVTLAGPGVPPALAQPFTLPAWSVFTAAAPGPNSFGAVPAGSAVVTVAFPDAQVAALQAALFPSGGYVTSVAFGASASYYQVAPPA